MGRRRKVPSGTTRTTLMRKHQVETLTEAADQVGSDFSDVVRATVDLLFPLDPDDKRCRAQAALQIRFEELRASNLIPFVQAGWGGREVALPMAIAKRPASIALIDETVRMLRRLYPRPPYTDAESAL